MIEHLRRLLSGKPRKFDSKTMKVTVELDRWEQQKEVPRRVTVNEDVLSVTLGIDWQRRPKFYRHLTRGKYRLTLSLEEDRETSFLLRLSFSLLALDRRGRVSRNTPLRERHLRPLFTSDGDLYFALDRSGVFAEAPAEWDEFKVDHFVRETLDYLRTPEATRHYEVHTDLGDEYDS
jgi:hypothetical protein